MADVAGSAGDLHLGTVVINVQDMRRAVEFWTAALGYARRERDWDPEQARHVERLTALGATRVSEWPYPDDADFVVMRDPDGNEFCVIDHPGQ
jgi:glyoxalase superfamily protein